MKKIIILLSLFLGSCAVSNQTYQTPSGTIRPPIYVNSTSKINPYIKSKDKNSYEHTYKKHIKTCKGNIYK